MVAAEGTATASFALVQPSETDAPRILAEAARLLQVKAPTLEELAAERQRAMQRDGAGRPARPSAGERDPRLAGLLRQMIQKDQTPEGVERLGKEIEALAAKEEAIARQLEDIATRVAGSKPFADGGYGIEAARAQIKRWAEKAKASEKPAPKEDAGRTRDF